MGFSHIQLCNRVDMSAYLSRKNVMMVETHLQRNHKRIHRSPKPLKVVFGMSEGGLALVNSLQGVGDTPRFQLDRSRVRIRIPVY